jgi:hypothetical protein
MRFNVLGPLEVIDDVGGRRDPAARRQRRLLLALLVWRNEAVSLDRLAEVVWADEPPPRDPVRSLRTYAARLRGALGAGAGAGGGSTLGGTPTGYVLRLDGHEVDADTFSRLTDQAAVAVERDPASALGWLDVALTLWRWPSVLRGRPGAVGGSGSVPARGATPHGHRAALPLPDRPRSRRRDDP